MVDLLRRRTGFKSWLFNEIVRRSPVSRLDLIAKGRTRGFIENDALGLNKFREVLLRLSERGVVLFDSKTVWWTGRALPPRGIGTSSYNRAYHAAQGDRHVLAHLRAEELAKIVARREAILWALRPADAPPVFPLPDIAARVRKPPRRKLEGTPRLKEILAQLKGDRLRSAIERAS